MSANREHNADELKPPTWLNSEFFTKVLRKSEGDETIIVKSADITPASFKGDHFASVMFRALLHYQQGKNGNTLKQISTITKTMPEVEGVKMDLLKESSVFETEIAMYEKVIPKFEAILRNAGDETSFGPRCLYSSLAPHKLIVFADLVPDDFTVLRDREINMAEVKLALQKLAKWHAVSLKVATEDPDYVVNYNSGIFSMKEFLQNPMMIEGMQQFIEILSETPSLKEYESHLRNIQTNLVEKSKSYSQEYLGNRRKGTTYVLCHGDFHLKNMMFREQPLDVKFLDFQISNMAPIAMDIIYAICMLLTPEQRLNHRDELYYHYHTEFVMTLKLIKFCGEIPTLRNFRAEILHYKYFELFLVVTFLPAIYAVIRDCGDPEIMFASRDHRKTMYQHPDFIKELETLLPYYLHLGYFEE